jgi:magnesium chelatase subunit H
MIKVLSQDTVISRGYDRLQTTLDHACSLTDDCSYRVANPIGLGSAKVVGTSVNPYDLDKYLSKRMTRRVDKQWPVSTNSERVSASATGDYVVSGLQLGNVFIGVQPLLGLEGILYYTILCYAGMFYYICMTIA